MRVSLSEITKRFNLNPHQLYKGKLKKGVDEFLISLKINIEKPCQRRTFFVLTEDVCKILLDEIVESKYSNTNDANRTKYRDFLTNFKSEEKEITPVQLAKNSEISFKNISEELNRLYDLDKKLKSLGITDDELIELKILHDLTKSKKIEVFESHLIMKTDFNKTIIEKGQITIVY